MGVIKTLYSEDRNRRVDIIARHDGAFTFEELRFSWHPREMCWLLVGPSHLPLIATAEQAETEARGRVSWLSDEHADSA